MAHEIGNDCVACPQGCIHCGRGWYRYFICDWCGEIYYGEDVDKYEDINGDEVCSRCLKRLDNGEIDENGNEIEDEEDGE